MSAYTPGPWDFIEPDGVAVRHPQIYSDSGPICNATWLGNERMNELKANACLLSASPDLLEALCAYRKKFPDHENEAFVQEVQDLGRMAREAIAKATGAAS